MKKINKQEEQVLQMMKHSSSLFPAKEQFNKIDDAAIGWAHRKRKTNPKLDTTDSMRFSTAEINDTRLSSPTISQKKAVRVMTYDDAGNVVITPASPVS